jgi:hypothetical protein
MRHLVVIEKGPTSFGAYVPDLPGASLRRRRMRRHWHRSARLSSSTSKVSSRMDNRSSFGEVVDVEAA